MCFINSLLVISGVFSTCGSTLNHAVVLVGYQTDDVWIVRNSWATTWGEAGYIRLAPGNTCGMQNHAMVPNLA
jgi:C1A family cysteine protease